MRSTTCTTLAKMEGKLQALPATNQLHEKVALLGLFLTEQVAAARAEGQDHFQMIEASKGILIETKKQLEATRLGALKSQESRELPECPNIGSPEDERGPAQRAKNTGTDWPLEVGSPPGQEEV